MANECSFCGDIDCICRDGAIEHPDHYQGHTLEVIDIIEDFDLNFHLGNAIKYILRAGKKGDRSEDLKKALWYLNRELTGKWEEEDTEDGPT